MVFKVYVGSMTKELEPLRPIVIKQIQALNMIPLNVEGLSGEGAAIVERAHTLMQEAGCFLTIIGPMRGWEPEGYEGKSLPEIEYDWARQMGQVSAVLIPNSKSPLDMLLRQRASMQETADRDRQEAFRQRVKAESEHVHWFSNEAELLAKIGLILGQWAVQQGEPLASLIPPPPAFFPALERRRDAPGAVSETDVEILAEKIALRTVGKLQEVRQREQEDLAKQALKLNEALRLQPGELVFGRPATTSQFKADVFMVMPFSADFNAIYQDIIIPTVTGLNMSIKRGDDFTSTRGSIMEEVWAALNACRFIIAEITTPNPNVYYELGIAHTLNKPAVLITQATQPEEVPFDIRHLRYLQYENTITGGRKLQEQLAASIARVLQDLEEGWGPQA